MYCRSVEHNLVKKLFFAKKYLTEHFWDVFQKKLMDHSRLFFVHYRPFQTMLQNKNCSRLGGIQTPIVGVKGEQDDHLTTTTALHFWNVAAYLKRMAVKESAIAAVIF